MLLNWALFLSLISYMNGLSCHVRSCGFKWSSLGLSALFTHPRQKKSLPFCSAVTSLSSPPHTRPFCPSCGTNTINNRVSGASPIGYAQPHHPEPKSGPAWNSEALGGSEAARDTEWRPPEETLFWPPDRPSHWLPSQPTVRSSHHLCLCQHSMG